MERRNHEGHHKRDRSEEALEHILTNVLMLDESSPIREALLVGGYQDPYSLVTMKKIHH